MRIYGWVIALSLLFCQISAAQSYQKMLKQTNYWSVTNCNSGCLVDNYWANQDTIIAGKSYKILDGYHYNQNMFLREDSLSRQIFFRTTLDNKDFLLYDFSLAIGDSIEISNPISPLPPSMGIYVLDSIVPKTIMAGVYHHFYLSSINNNNTTIWVEGLGSLCLINTPGGLADLSGIGELSCHFKNGIQVYEADTLPLGPCTAPLSTETSPTQKELAVHVFPNPSTGKFNVRINPSFHQAKIEVFNTLSSLVHTQQLQHSPQQEIRVSLSSGLYFIRFKIDNAYTTQPIIIE